MQKQNVAILLAAGKRGRLSRTEAQVRLAAIDLIWGCQLAGAGRRKKIQGNFSTAQYTKLEECSS